MPYLEIEKEYIIFDPEVQTYCNNSEFKCPNYNHSWACPPVSPYLEEEVSTYKKFFLIYYKFDLDTYISEVKQIHPDRSIEKILQSFYRKSYMRDHLEVEIFNFLEENDVNYNEKLVLWDGFCRLCYKENQKCTYDGGKSCRYEPRYSMEAVGINVDKTVKNIGFEIEWPPTHFAYRFGLVCVK
jgi:predicted metal-binding protein